MRILAALVLAAAFLLAGCVGPPSDPMPDETNDTESSGPWPQAFQDPMQVLLGDPSLTTGAAGEPNLAIGPDGTRYVGVLGCMEGQSLGLEETAACRHGLIYRSDDGMDWTLLNQGTDRRLGDGPYANGDTTIVVTQNAVHVLLLGSGTIHYHRSTDRGESWEYLGAVGQGDRPWLAAAPDGRILSSWIQGQTVVVRVSDDDGETWSTGSVDARAARQGRVVWGPACACFLTPLFVRESGAGLINGDTELERVGIQVWRSDDGKAWELSGEFEMYPMGLSGMLSNDYAFIMPAVGQSTDGLTAVAWSTGVGPEPGIRSAARLYVATAQNASGWGPIQDMTAEESAVLPALAGGHELVLAYYSSPLPGDPERIGVWSMRAHFMQTDQHVVVEENVHQGGICPRGALCGGIADRSLFDFFEATPLLDGRVALAYTADPVTEGKKIRIHYAEQSDS